MTTIFLVFMISSTAAAAWASLRSLLAIPVNSETQFSIVLKMQGESSRSSTSANSVGRWTSSNRKLVSSMTFIGMVDCLSLFIGIMKSNIIILLAYLQRGTYCWVSDNYLKPVSADGE